MIPLSSSSLLLLLWTVVVVVLLLYRRPNRKTLLLLLHWVKYDVMEQRQQHLLHFRRLYNYNRENCTISSVLFPASVLRASIETRPNCFGISIYADGPQAEYVGSDPQSHGTIARLPPGFLANPENQPYC